MKITTTTREFDEQGRMVKETVEERSDVLPPVRLPDYLAPYYRLPNTITTTITTDRTPSYTINGGLSVTPSGRRV